MLYSINLHNFIVLLHLLFEILGNMYIAIVCFSGCDVINFEINLIFRPSHFHTGAESQDKNLNSIFHHF